MISLVIPARNEAARLPATLARYTAALSATQNDLEVIVVANDCRDGTVDAALDMCEHIPGLSVVDIDDPIGKGGAVLEGFRAAKVSHVLFADADGATEPSSIVDLIDLLDDHDVAVGSRGLPESVVNQNPSALRRAFSAAFSWTVRRMFRLPIADTQCGAKAFRGDIARHMADGVRERGWAFDIELLLYAYQRGCRVAEMPVRWTDQPGSQLRASRALPEVAAAILRLWTRNRRALRTSQQLGSA